MRDQGIGTFRGIFGDYICRAVHDIGIVAQPANQGIDAGIAIEAVIAAIARQDVGGRVTGAVQVGGTRQDQVFDVCRQRDRCA